jgi:hypothetical protein
VTVLTLTMLQCCCSGHMQGHSHIQPPCTSSEHAAEIEECTVILLKWLAEALKVPTNVDPWSAAFTGLTSG